MISYDVPLHAQDDGSDDCGPVSTAMILDYFGITSDQQEVIDRVARCDWGTSSFSNGETMIDYGLTVELITATPLLFDGDFLRTKPSAAQLKAKIIEVKRKQTKTDKQELLQQFLDYLDKGGVVTPKIPTAQHIINALDAGKLVAISTYTKVLGVNEGTYHFVVVGGYNDSEFLVYNPWPKSRRKSWEPIEDVMFSIHTSTLFDYDNGSMLIVGKPQS